MNLNPSQKLLNILMITLTLTIFLEQAYGQKSNQFLETAASRSQNSAKTINVITSLTEDQTIPAELFNKSKAIGVFPDIVKMNLMFRQGMKGYGVICSRQSKGWSLPSYYGFASLGWNLKLVSFKSFDLIVLFMNEDIINQFQKGKLELKGIKSKIAGPIGKVTPDAEKADIIIYALIDGTLKGMDIKADDIFSDTVINPDNNINKAIYGIKGREVLQGKAPKLLPTTSAVTAFREILNEKFFIS